MRKNRAIDDSDMDHLYYPVKFFEQFAIENNLSFQLIDKDISDLGFYESAPYRFFSFVKELCGESNLNIVFIIGKL